MKVTVIPIEIGTLGTVTKGLVKGLEDLEIRGRVETIQTTALLISTRILRRILEICCHSDSSERPSAYVEVKISQGVIIIIIIKPKGCEKKDKNLELSKANSTLVEEP